MTQGGSSEELAVCLYFDSRIYAVSLEGEPAMKCELTNALHSGHCFSCFGCFRNFLFSWNFGIH